jgi:hypothetical protein
MAALVAAIHTLPSKMVFMGGRDKPGHDETGNGNRYL